MTIPYCIQVGDRSIDSCKVEETIRSAFSEIDAIYNNWNPDSEISQLNRLKAHHKAPLSTKLWAFLEKTDALVKKTEGLFDPTVAPLSHLWKDFLKKGELPPTALLTDREKAVGWSKIHLEKGLFWKENDETSLDLGAVAKGYGVDLLIEKLQSLGLKSLYVEWGGEIRTMGSHPQARPWRIGIAAASPINLTDRAIATSGTTYQLWHIDGGSYSHIINPLTKRPLCEPQITTISVIAPTCMEADALATALMLFPSTTSARNWALAHDVQLATP